MKKTQYAADLLFRSMNDGVVFGYHITASSRKGLEARIRKAQQDEEFINARVHDTMYTVAEARELRLTDVEV